MTIEGLGPIQPTPNVNQKSGAQQAPRRAEGDSVDFSEEARIRADLLRATEDVRQAEDVRWDRIEEVRQKLQDPSYIDNTVLNSVADRLMDLFDI